MTEGPRIVWMPGGVRTEIHLAVEDTDGAFCLLVDEPPVGWSLPPHRHLNEAETIYVVDGEFEMTIEGSRSHLTAGQTVHIPRGAIHSGRNIGDDAGRRLVMFSPAGLERFFVESGASTADAEIDLATVLASASRHGWQFVREGDRAT